MSGGLIQEMVEPGPEVEVDGHYLIPGMIDLQINGAGGGDAAEGTPEALARMARTQAAAGVTSFLPTLISDQPSVLMKRLKALAGLLKGDQVPGAVPLGIHLEGPFLNPNLRGAHPASALQTPSPELFSSYFEASAGKIRMITLAPELPGALQLIPLMRECMPIISLGHSEADFETAQRAIEAGANSATHVFNAMGAFHHREPGLLGAVLGSSAVTAGIIADGIHVHPQVVRLLFRLKGARRIVQVTDAISAAAMPDGHYRVGGVEVSKQAGVCRNREGRLAGSSLQMIEGLRNLCCWLSQDPGLQLTELLATATIRPADLLGLPGKGRIEAGADADLVLLDRELQVQKTWVGGECVYEASSG